MRQTLKANVYTRRNDIPVSFPACWVVCPACDGGGTDRGRHFECDGGGFTASEWAEQDEDFRDDYMSGRLDRPCGACKGRSTVLAIDVVACTGWRLRILLAEYRRQMRDSAEIDAMEAAERRMGA